MGAWEQGRPHRLALALGPGADPALARRARRTGLGTVTLSFTLTPVTEEEYARVEEEEKVEEEAPTFLQSLLNKSPAASRCHNMSF